MSECKLTMQPQDNVVRELEVTFSTGESKVLSNETRPATPDELPKSWNLTDIESVYWAKGPSNLFPGYGNYADHYVVRDCQIYDAKTDLPGYHGETPYWRASIKLEAVPSTSSTTSTTASTTSTTSPEVTTTSTSQPVETSTSNPPELITNVGSTPIPTIPANELPFTGPPLLAVLITLFLLLFGLGMIIKAYYLNWIQKIERDIEERANAKAKHPSGSLRDEDTL
jgi:hypothetical protein